MDSTISVSKGCFAFTTPEKNRKKILKKSLNRNEVWYKEYDKRKMLSLQKQTDFYRSVYGNFIEEVVDFVKNSGESLLSNSLEVVPAAMVLTGMAQADHTHIFSVLTSKIKEDITTHVALLKGKDCLSLKLAIQSIVWQFTTTLQSKAIIRKANNHNQDESDYESSNDEEVFTKDLKRSDLNFPSLIRLYTSIGNNDPKQKMRKSTPDSCRKPLVIIVSDVEGSSPCVLQDLIYLCKNYLKHLPVVLVFSIATAPSLLGRYLTESALLSLCFKFIHSPSPFTIFPELINELVISHDSLFQLGGRTLKLMVHTFHSLDNSLSGFMRTYHFCMMEHFFANPVNSLCCELSDLKNAIKELSDLDLEGIRQLPSFRKFVESKPPKERAPLLLDDEHLKKVVCKLMKNLHAHMWEFHAAIRVLNTISSKLPGKPFGCQLYETFIRATTKDILSTHEFEEALKLLKMMSKEEFIKTFLSLYSFFEDTVEQCPGRGSTIKEVVHEMKKSLDIMAEGEQENSDMPKTSAPKSPREMKASNRVLQDSPSKNTVFPIVVCERLKIDSYPSPHNKAQKQESKEKGAELSTPPRTPRKSIGSTPINGLHDSPSKRLRMQSTVSKLSSPSQSPCKGHSNDSMTESPSKRSSGRIVKTPKSHTPKNPNCTPKDASKDTLEELGLSGGKIDKNQLRERLLLLSNQKKEMLANVEAKWDMLKEEILQNLRKALTLSLGEGPNPLSTFPLYEVVMFENVETVRSHLLPPSPQATLHSALTNPKQYLECNCCTLSDNTSIIPSLPDISIAYKLHLECGRMINLYDWLQAFSVVVNSDGDEDKEVQIDVNMQARFMQAVAELQFMGFVKATKRKTDHVLRLTWGGLKAEIDVLNS